jgi:hypothetical protein
MSFLDGLDAEIADAFVDDFRDAVLSLPGARVSDGQGGYIPGPPTEHACKALVTEYDALRRPSDVPATDRKVLVLGATIEGSAVPVVGAKITAPDPLKGGLAGTFEVIALGGDPAAAVFELQAR